MPRGDLATARLHRDWLKKLPALTGRPLTRLAKEIKIAPSTLTRPLTEGENGTSTLHANTIAKVVSHTGVSGPSALGATPAAGRRGPRGFGEEAAPYVADYDSVLEAALMALIAGRPAVAPWTLNTRALELAGYMPGDVLLLDLNNVTPSPGDVVCAQIYDWPRMMAQTVVRIFEHAKPVGLLVSRSLDPAVQSSIVLDQSVEIKGVFLPHRLRPGG